jgi:hypothetical protein
MPARSLPRGVRPVLAATALLALALPLAAPAGALPDAPGAAPDRSPTRYLPDEERGDVSVRSRADVRNAVVRPRSVDVRRWSYTIDRDRERFVVRIKAGDFVRPATRNGFTTLQYADVFVSYGRSEAFGLGVSNRRPDRNEMGADVDVVGAECARSLRRASTQMRFAEDVVRFSVSLACIPVGQEIRISGSTSLWVNPERPPNTEVAADDLQGIDFTREV